MKKTLLALLVASSSVGVYAEECEVSALVGGISYHGDRTKDHNEENWGLGVSACSWNLYTYKNSHGSITTVASKDFLYDVGYGLELGAMAGIATAYTDGGEPMYAGMLKARYTYNNLFAELHHIPNGQDWQGVVTELHLGYKFGTYNVSKSDWSALENFSIDYLYGWPGGKLSIGYEINEKWSVRATITNSKIDWADYWYHNDDKEVEMYQSEHVHFQTTGVEFDYSPWGNGFSVYAGVVYNNTDYKTEYSVHVEGGGNYNAATVNLGGEPVIAYHGDELYGKAEWDKVAFTYGIRYDYDFGDEGGWSLVADLGGTHFMDVADKELTYVSAFASDQERIAIHDRGVDWINGDTVDARYSGRDVPSFRAGLKYEFYLLR